MLGTFAVGGAGYPPLPAHLLQNLPDLNRAPFNSKPISSGPFVLTQWNHGSSLEFEPNPYYWRGKPGLMHLTYRFIPSAETLLSQMQTHEVDVYESVGENQIAQLPQIPGIVISKRLSANWRRLAFNTRKPQLADRQGAPGDRRGGRLGRHEPDHLPRLQRARGERHRAQLLGRADHRQLPARPGRREAAARRGRLAHRARAASGPRTACRCASRSRPRNAKQSNIQAEVLMQQQLKGVGIELEIKNYPGSLLFAHDGPIYTGKYDSEFTIETNGPDPDNEGLWSGAFLPPHGTNATYLNDPVVNRASHDALLTYDRVKRKALYQREESRIHQLVPAVFFYWQNSYSAVNGDMKGWRDATYISSFWNCYEWSI